MPKQAIQTICKIRAVVGYLGEKDQAGWWESSFFAASSPVFLAPLFSRTQVLAQVNGVTRAAAMVHDNRIGMGRVYHLFRLPEDMERGIYQALHHADLCAEISVLVAAKATAMGYLQEKRAPQADDALGPLLVGTAQTLREVATWTPIAFHYGQAFERETPIFPYFSDQV